MRRVLLVTFSINSKKFKSIHERNTFFKLLYGWRQVIVRNNKKYVYERKGILQEIPHSKIDQSSFLIPEKEFEKIERFLKEWEDKVIWRCFKVLLNDSEWEELFGDWDG